MKLVKATLGEIYRGLFKENPIFILNLGLCPALATSTSLKNSLGMGLSTTSVLLLSNVSISLLVVVFKLVGGQDVMKRIEKIRVPIYIVIIASFVSIVDMILKGYFPALAKELGLFIALIVVNCNILGRAETFASKNTLFASLMDAIGIGLGFTGALMLIGSIREILGAGQIMGLRIFGENFKPAIIFILAPGAFITIGLLMGFFRFLTLRREKRV
ncbi:MAG: electron transport complex subunit RsxE [bacterium]|nr:electron transport complex subunit RsxE [bacterium]